MNARSPIPAKVSRHVPVLASPHEGEIVGAARAIGRTLQAAGLDFHALAAAISAPEVDAVAREADEGPQPKAEAAHRKPQKFSYGDWKEAWAFHHIPRRFTPRQEERHRKQVAYCKGRLGRLSRREQTFIRGISPLRGNLSYAQADWLAAITDRLEGADRERAFWREQPGWA
ncbi:hypothetical protein [Methylobacterium oxalidis]|uniref:Uncharacterized protein n=1 Tax=Methylobacterium oxalidis TaxID=944322 RepID=A0A512J9Y3_9HYPH|nr:hypothetical protein [Methylobacterium oxalidis]GEP06772.1 hypothetical protein MOX02_48100 [Methylobacterium oxalidis]GLS67980.1 hypothetical protein GCM10007888_63650 [Methylobacterium oxalidis]